MESLSNVGLLTWMGAFLFIVFFYGPWQKGLTDWYREQAFSVRDELFDFAARGEVSFTDPAYVGLRDSLNKQIRYAHRATWFNVLVHHLTLRFLGVKPYQREIPALPPAVAARINPRLKLLERALLAQMVWRSLFVIPLLLSILIFCLICRQAIRVVFENFSSIAFKEALSAAGDEPLSGRPGRYALTR